jgi:hypothetical protein
MQEPGSLEAALQMLDRFGVNAEFQAGDEMDRALELGDEDSFDKWRLIGETIAALSRRSPTISLAQDQPAEAVLLVHAGRTV